MNWQGKKNYLSHKGYPTKVSDALSMPAPQGKERIKIHKMIYPCLKYLKENSVDGILNFVILLQKHGFDSKSIINLFCDFGLYAQIECLIKRSFKKANFEEKNIVINRIVYKYDNQFIDFLSNYDRQNLPFVKDIDLFIQEFKDTIQMAKCCTLNEEPFFDPYLSDLESPLDEIENEKYIIDSNISEFCFY